MKVAPHPSCNRVLQGSKDGAVLDLPCALMRATEDGTAEGRLVYQSFRTFWAPSKEELAALNAGRPVVLEIVGAQHPPVFVGVSGDDALGTVGQDGPKEGTVMDALAKLEEAALAQAEEEDGLLRFPANGLMH